MTVLDKRKIFASLGYEPHELQAEVHACEAPRRVVASGVRFGKTKCAAMEAVAAALEPTETPARGWVVAPDYGLAEKVYREIVLTFAARLRHHVVRIAEHEPGGPLLLVRNMGGETTEIRAKSADNPTALLGEGLDWLVVDEAARLRPDVWDRYLQARLIDKRGWALLISTPKGKGWFYDAWRSPPPLWKSWNAPTWSNPHISRAEVEAVRERIPEAVFRQEYLAEFLEGAGQVFRNVRDLATGAHVEPLPGEDYVAGLDLAQRADYTVIVVLDSNRQVVAWDRFTRVDWSTQIGRVRALTERYNDAWTLVDSTGAGEPIFEALAEAGVRCEGYVFTQSSKAALVNNLAMLVERRDITLPTATAFPELVDEVESFEYNVTDSGNVKTGAPAGRHDDCVCALMLAAWGSRNAGEWKVQEVG